MALRRALPFATLLAVAEFHVEASQPSGVEDALAMDDECAAGDVACTLNELQLRAGKTAAAEEVARVEQQHSRLETTFWWKRKSPTEARTHPKYCDTTPADAPQSPWCTGNSTCRCDSYCKTVAPRDWGWDPNCCGCSNFMQLKTALLDTVVFKKGPAAPGATAAAANPGSGRGVKALKHPSYCQHAPAASSPWCTGAPNCQCVGYCTASVAPTNWGFDPNCCGCGDAFVEEAALVVPDSGSKQRPTYCAYQGSKSAPACVTAFSSCTCSERCKDLPAARRSWDSSCCGCHVALVQVQKAAPLAHPLYCNDMPKGGAESPWCTGANTCKCDAYCHPSVPPTSWGWDPNCCGCSDKGNQSASVSASSSSAGPVPGSVPVNVSDGGLTHPIYCQSQPLGSTSEWCQGASTCSCQPYCTMAVLPSQWGWDPQCCGCGTADKQQAKSPETPAVPSEGLKHPAYCSSVPAGSSPYCEGESTCTCQLYCLASYLPSSWAWDPQCCGCTESGKADSDKKESDSALAPEVPRDQPSYCAKLPPLMNVPWCAVGVKTCTCQAYCSTSVVPALWGDDPNCCACSGDMVPEYKARSKPIYCDTLPPGIYLPWCEGYNTCDCQTYCKTSVATSLWGWDPSCCGCDSGKLPNVKAGTTAVSA